MYATELFNKNWKIGDEVYFITTVSSEGTTSDVLATGVEEIYVTRVVYDGPERVVYFTNKDATLTLIDDYKRHTWLVDPEYYCFTKEEAMEAIKKMAEKQLNELSNAREIAKTALKNEIMEYERKIRVIDNMTKVLSTLV